MPAYAKARAGVKYGDTIPTLEDALAFLDCHQIKELVTAPLGTD